MESERQGGVKKVLSIIVVQPCKLTTSQNVGIGSSVKTVREKYNKLIDVSNSSTDFIVVGSIYGGTVFTLKNGVVSKIFIGAAAE
jgi:mannose/fructose-specific phosphotransferase system component IIA